MVWYNSLIIAGIILGFLMAIFGSYHGYGKMKTGLLGWAIIIFLLIVRTLIWLIGTF